MNPEKPPDFNQKAAHQERNRLSQVYVFTHAMDTVEMKLGKQLHKIDLKMPRNN